MSLLTLSEKAKARFNALPKEEQERIIANRKENEERERVEHFLHQSKCPYCGQKLVRGKKDKSLDYKRTWQCISCDKTIT